MVYESFILEFRNLQCNLTLVDIVEIKIKIRTYFKQINTKQYKNTVVEKNVRLAMNFHKKNIVTCCHLDFFNFTWNKNNATPEKRFLAVAILLNVLRIVSFQAE